MRLVLSSFKAILFAWILFSNSLSYAGELIRVSSSQAVKVNLFWEAAPNARATVLLFPGGGGGFGQVIDGKPSSGNFLVRSYQHFIAAGLNVAIFGKPSDSDDLDYEDRISNLHLYDMQAVLEEVKKQSSAPIWLIGTSRGTISAAHAAINLKDKAIAGLVLTASVVSYKKTGAIPTQAIERISVPTLVVHHNKDACIHCKPHEVKNIINGLKQVPRKELVMVDGGHSPIGDVCQGLHWHGFINHEQATINIITSWMQK